MLPTTLRIELAQQGLVADRPMDQVGRQPGAEDDALVLRLEAQGIGLIVLPQPPQGERVGVFQGETEQPDGAGDQIVEGATSRIGGRSGGFASPASPAGSGEIGGNWSATARLMAIRSRETSPRRITPSSSPG